MSKSLNRCILAVVCIALVCALGLSLLFIGGETTVVAPQEGQAASTARNTATYTHGSKVKTAPSDAREVRNKTDFFDAIGKKQDIDLQADLELKMPTQTTNWEINLPNSEAFRSSTANGDYTGTLYGNGHTISYNGAQEGTNLLASYIPNGGGNFSGWDLGGVINTLSGTIYDLNVVMTSGSMAFMAEDNTTINIGGIVGYMYGDARIENCTFTMQTNGRLAAGKESSSTGILGGKQAFPACGGIVGRIADSGNPTIVNCTVNMNGGTIAAGLCSGSSISGNYGLAGLVVGACWRTATVNNIMVNGSGTLNAQYAANIGCTVDSGTKITTNYYYNNFSGTYPYGGSANAAWTSESGSASVTNRILGPNTNDTSSAPKIANNSGYNVYFDPKSSDATNFLAIEFTGETYQPGQYNYAVNNANGSAVNGATFSANSSNKVVVRNLPATPSTWNSGGTFTANLVKTSKFDPTSYAKLTKYDHGYVDPDNRTTNGTPIGTGEAFEAVFSPSGKISGTDYYLTKDIVITGFTGKEFSGTLDGNGHTIFITGANTCAAQHIGGIVGTLTGTIKNVRVVLVNSVTANTSVSNANVGLVAGHINGGSLINVSVDIPADVTLTHTDSGNDSSLGGIAGSAVSGATFTNVTMNFNGTLSNIKTSGAGGGYWPFTSAFVGKPYFKDSANSSADCATFNNIIIRGNGTFASQSSADDEPPYYAAIGIIQYKGVTNSTAAVYNVNGLIYDFNPQFADNQGATSGNHGACYGLFVNNNNNNAAQVQYYDRLVNYGSGGVYNASGKEIEEYAFNKNGNAPVPNPSNIKNITKTVSGVAGSTVKAYFMPGTAASPNLTLVAAEPSSGWSDVDRLQLNDQSNLYSTNDGTNKVVHVAKTTAESMSGENLTLSPYNPYTVITASLDNSTKVYDGSPFAAQVSFAVGGSPVSLTEGQYTITYTDGNATGETNAGSYNVTITLQDTAVDSSTGKTYVFENNTTSTTIQYTITKKTVSLASGLATTLGGTFGEREYTYTTGTKYTITIPEGVEVFDAASLDRLTIPTDDYYIEIVSPTDNIPTSGGLIPANTYTYRVNIGNSQNFAFTGNSANADINSVTIDRYALTGTWTLSGLEITYGDAAPDDYDQYIRIELTNEGTIPGGLTGVTANGFTADYVQGTTQAGETVTITAGTFTVGSGFTASNYNFSGIAGSGSVEVQKREITISAADSDLAVGHIVAIYGGTNYVTSQAELQNLLTWANVSDYVENVYDTDEIGFTITAVAHEQTGDGATYAPGEAVQEGEWAKLPANDTYYITVTSTNDNYTVAADNYFKYQVSPAELLVTGVVWDDTALDTITYDGQDHNYTVKTTGLVKGDNLEDVINVSVTYNSASHSGAMVNAGTYTVTVELKQEGGNYDLQIDVLKTYTLTISPITFTVQDASATFTQYTASNEAAKVLEDMIVAGDTLPDEVQLSTVVSGQIPYPNHSGVYLAFKSGGYTVEFAIKTDYTTNYAFAVDGATSNTDSATLMINPYNLENATIEVNPGSNTYTYNGKTQTVPVTVTTAEDANIFDFVTISGNKQKNAGYNYQVTVSGNSSNISGEQRTAGTWSIAKATITIAGTDALTSEYSGEAVDPATLLSATYITVSGAASGEDVYSMLTATSADGEILNYKEGGYTVNIALDEMKEGASNYEISGDPVSVTYTVTKKAVTVTWTAEDIVFGSADAPAAKITDFGGILEKDQNCTLLTTDTYESTMAVGTEVTYTVSTLSWDNEDIQNNYDITYDPANTITVHVVSPEVEIDLTDDPTTFTYIYGYTTVDEFLSKFTIVNSSGTPTSANYSVTITDSNSQPVTLNGERLDVGTYTVTITSTQYQPTGNTSYTYEVEPYDLSTPGLTVTVDDDDLVYTGEALNPIVTVMVDDEDITDLLEIGGNTATDVSATGYTVTVSAGSNANFTGTPSFNGTWNIAPKPITIAGVEGALTSVYDGAEIAVSTLIAENYIKVEGAATSFTYSMLTATVQEGATVQNAGNYTIIITLNAEAQGSGNYTIEGGSATVTYTVTPATLTVAANEGATLSRDYDGNTTEANSFLTADFLTVTGNVPSDNIYAMLNAAVADDKTIRDAGVYTVTITFNAQAVGASNYNGADINVSLTYTVNRKVITVAFDGYTDLTYNGEAHKITATVQGFVNDEAIDITDLVAISGTGTSALNAGSYTATVSKTAVEGAYNNYTLASDATQEFTIAQATLTLTEKEGATLSREYGGNTTEASTFVSDAYVTVDGFVDADGTAYDLLTATVADSKTIKNADTYTITFALTNADGNYTLTAPVSLTYTIDPKTLTADSVMWTHPDYTYSGSAIAPTPAWAEGAIVTDDNVTITATISAEDGSELTDNQAVNSGNYTATVAAFTNGNYKLSENATCEFTIARKQVEITWTDGGEGNFVYTYDGTAKAPTASVVGAVDESHFTNINEKVTIDGIADKQAINAGDYIATITKVAFEEAYANYTIAEDSKREFVINPQPVTVTMTMKDSESTDVTSPLTWNVSSAIVVERAENVWTLTSGDVSYTVTVTGFESVVGFNSSKLELHLNDDEYTGTPYGTPVTDGVLGIVSADPNYEISTTNPIRFNVVPSLAIELTSGAEISVVYGVNKSYDAAADTNNAFAQYFTVQTSDGSVAPAGTWSYTVVGENQAQTIQDVGTYTIEATYIVTDGGAPLKNSIKFSITAAQVSDVTLGTITYGDLSKTGDTITATITYADGISVDAELGYTAEDITAGDGKTITLGAYTNENANYAGFDSRKVTVKIEKKAVTVTVTPESTTYTGSDIALGVEIDGAVYEEELAVTFGANIESAATQSTTMTVRNAGTYTITDITLTGDAASNYTVGSFTESITIAPAPVTVEVKPEYTSYRGVEIALFGTITGGVFGTDEVSVGVITTNNPVRDAGTYTITDITLTGAAANNYVMSAASTSSFTIAKAEATLSIENYATINGQEYNGQRVTITPVMTVGDASLPTDGIVEVSINDKTDYPGTATDQILYAGEYTVTLTVYGDNNIEDTSVYFTVTIAQKAVKVITDDASAYSYDGTAKDLNERVAEEDGVIGDDVVTATVDSIVDESGTTVTELKNAGTYTVTFGLSGDDARNYVIEEEDSSMTVTINPARVTVTVTPASDTYTGSNITVNGTINGKVEGDEVSATITTTVRNAHRLDGRSRSQLHRGQRDRRQLHHSPRHRHRGSDPRIDHLHRL